MMMWSLENVSSFVVGIMITVALWELYPEVYKHSFQNLNFGKINQDTELQLKKSLFRSWCVCTSTCNGFL